MKKKRIIVEIRMPDAIQGEDILRFAIEKIQVPGFEMDPSFEPVPAAPIDALARELSASKERIMNIRAIVPENMEVELKKIPCIVDVWTDASVEPFDVDL